MRFDGLAALEGEQQDAVGLHPGLDERQDIVLGLDGEFFLVALRDVQVAAGGQFDAVEAADRPRLARQVARADHPGGAAGGERKTSGKDQHN